MEESDTRLYNIGEVDEDSSSTIQLTDRTSTETDEGSGSGSARYMERLKNHLGGELAVVNDYEAQRSSRRSRQSDYLNEDVTIGTGSDYNFETPRSIRELLDTIETPVATSRDRSSRSDEKDLDEYFG